jgi:hypothetical protein
MLFGNRDAGAREGPAAALSRLRRDDRGMTIVLVALTLAALIGFTALGVETGLWYVIKRQNQSAADVAALSGAFELLAGLSSGLSQVTIYPDICNLAQRDAARNNFTFNSFSCPSTTPGCTNPPPGEMCVNIRPALTGRPAVEVILSQQQNTFLASLSLPSVTIDTRAVAVIQTLFNACILGLDTKAPNTINLSHHAALSNPNCGVASNSKDPSSSLSVDQSSIASPVSVVGGESVTNGGAITGKPNLIGAPPVTDPYAGVAYPAPGTCVDSGTNSGILRSGGNHTLSSGTFCNGFDFEGTGTITLQTGTYIIQKQLFISDHVTVNGTGVTLIINYANGNYTLTIDNNSTINITAPTSGTYKGLAFFGPRNSNAGTQDFGNNNTLNITGAIYFPSETVSISDHINNPNGCTQIIADKLAFQDDINIGDNCAGTGIEPVNVLTAQLAE